MDEEPGFRGGFSADIARAFRELMNSIRAAPNENTLRAIGSYHFEKLKGRRPIAYSMRLNKQYRLVFAIQNEDGGNRLVITGIEDYH
jgi:proteic killer suppression protein